MHHIVMFHYPDIYIYKLIYMHIQYPNMAKIWSQIRTFADLLRSLSDLDISRIRFLTSHPRCRLPGKGEDGRNPRGVVCM